MNNILKFSKMPEKSGSFSAEATPDGVRIGSRLIGFSSIIRQLDEGRFDKPISEGFGVIAELSLAEIRGWFQPSIEQQVNVWRWMVAGVFIVEQMQANGTVEVDQGDGTTAYAVRYVGEHGGIVVYPATERFSLARNIEELAFEQFTHDNPHQKALMIYQSMLEAAPDGGMTLSTWGRDAMTMLHDGFIEMLNTEGMPAAPIAH
ncbi:hypothetical protein N5J75_11260 [Pantoea brenneri]|uniref:hypothetical protein n=1 Tax=Pantoea brenneri TaxID=472694 RepID=UPI00244C36D6|nr:hypothetical protein [Pantoea brenneri]MDH2123776.1 hypothetical protein [Pantoea brenneri]